MASPASIVSAADIRKSSFGDGFFFGTASAAYQFEGAHKLHRQPCIWDTFTHDHPEKIKDRSNGDMAVGHYDNISGDIGLMNDLGFNAYRFSISWSRIMNYGEDRGTNKMVNKESIEYYKKYINELKSKGLEPFVTLFHFDVPQQLEDEYNGFLDRRIVSDFEQYAEVCFKAFGDQVKHWITINEPHTFAENGYDSGKFAPGRNSENGGDSGKEPYIVSHNILLAHAHAVQAYKKYKDTQHGVIGITLSTYWFEPYSTSEDDKNASQRAQDFMFGWYMNPLTFGDYPESMKKFAEGRIPKFEENESKLVKGSYDFLGLNYYTAIYAGSLHPNDNIFSTYGIDFRLKLTTYKSAISLNHLVSGNIESQKSYRTDNHVKLTPIKDEVPIGTHEAPVWMYVYPRGIRDLLLYVKEKYENPPIYITENGVGQYYYDTTTSLEIPSDDVGIYYHNQHLQEILNDDVRINYHSQHLQFLLKAKKDVDVKGYFAWSLLDNFEWADGYTVGFGIYHVDRKTMKRTPKKSATWFKEFLEKK